MEYTYADILAIVKANGDILTASTGSLSGTYEIDLRPYQEAVMQLDFKEFKDQRLESDITATAANPSVDLLLGINKQGIGDSISDTNHGSVIIDSERVMINAKDDFALLFGSTGVALGSPNRVNIDSGQSITLFAHDRLLLGLPNRGLPFKQTTQAAAGGTTKGDPTPDQEYEPLVLGIKLANLLEDILFFLKKADLVSGVSPVRFQPTTLAEFALLANRIPEILSSYAFIDGYSHETINQETLKQLKEAQKKAENYSPPTKITGSVEGVVSVSISGAGGDYGGTGYDPLKKLIFSGESTSYDAMYPSTTFKARFGVTCMSQTIKAVYDKLGGGDTAIGRYQNLAQYLLSRAKSAGLDANTALYDEANQEKMGENLIADTVGGYLKGTTKNGSKEQLIDAVQWLGRCWASLPVVKNGIGAIVGDIDTGAGLYMKSGTATGGGYYTGKNNGYGIIKSKTVASSVEALMRVRKNNGGSKPAFIPSYVNWDSL